MRCPNCGHELPGVSHFGLQANPKNYIAPPIHLRPGRKYYYRFALIYYPPRPDPEIGSLDPCLVVANEEVPKEGGRTPFISGSKFYPEDMALLELAVDRLLAAQIAFKSMVTGREPASTLHSRLSTISYEQRYRQTLADTVVSMIESMRRCAAITERET
jgi:hypothetical protein